MTDSWSELNPETLAIWEQNAAFWDAYMGEGNDFHRLLVSPTAERLLDVRTGERVLELACGNGAFARRLAVLGAQVTACDGSTTFIERARARGAPDTTGGEITYHAFDASDHAAWSALPRTEPFDAAVCNMALMDIADIAPLLGEIRARLAPGGRFVFTTMHPCFNSPLCSVKVVEEEDRDGDLRVRFGMKVLQYLTPVAGKGLGIIGQPAPHYYFHRPLHLLLGACFRAGFVLDALEEPGFAPGAIIPTRPTSWAHFTEFPPVLAARLRPVRIPGRHGGAGTG
jgi:2-polyprenyl-3-methyl-5-hydroxy-6-metoxy-1,4-benzoquinol methylase